jgi:hypothetical protein
MWNEKQYCIRPFWSFYIVDKYVDEEYGLFFTKTRKVWKPLDMFWNPITWKIIPMLFNTKDEAKKFVNKLKQVDTNSDIEYL